MLFFVGLFFAVVAAIAFFIWIAEGDGGFIPTLICACISFACFAKYKKDNEVVEKIVQETPSINLGEKMSELFSSVNWWYVGFAFLAYVVVGILWATWKWYRLSLSKAAEYKKDKSKDPSNKFVKPENYIPRVKQNKARITGWMAFWPINAPFDIGRYILCDLLVDFWNQIYKSISAYFTHITRNAFKEDYVDDNQDN